ncbi:MAG: protein kinase [Nannocystaceae bacterium]|nr:protein kinase [Nannocystaceae bacterium]
MGNGVGEDGEPLDDRDGAAGAAADTVIEPADSEPAHLESQMALARARSKLLGKPATPAVIGRYEVIDRLGAGGMGIVYSARDPDLDRIVAVKVLRSRLIPDSQGRSRLVREAQALAKLSHPNVVHVYEVGRDSGQVFIAMEFVKGRTLSKWVRDEEPSVAEVLAKFVAAGRGLLAAHTAGVIHRDFKPENVLVGDDDRVRVMDFGLARPSIDGDTLTEMRAPAGDLGLGVTPESMTQTGMVMGTPAYMDPQQLLGTTADARSDQYSFCVSLYESLVGRRPFKGSTVTELFATMRDGKPESVEFPGGKVPRSVQPLLRRGLAYDRDRRYPTFAELLGALEAAAVARPSRWSRWLLPAAGVVALASAGTAMRGYSDAGDRAAGGSVEAPADPWAAIVDATDLPSPVPTPLPEDPVGVTVHRLRNGLTVYVVPRSGEPIVRMQVVVRAGPSEEPEGARGLSIWMTNALQEGTGRLGVLDSQAEAPFLARQHKALAALSSATTPEARKALLQEAQDAHKESIGTLAKGDVRLVSKAFGVGLDMSFVEFGTSYDSVLSSGALEGWLELQAERLRRPAFRGLVMQLNSALEDLPWTFGGSLHYQALMGRLARAYGKGHDVEGAYADLGRVPFDDLRDFHDTYYRPNNIALVLVGDVNPDSVLPIVEQAFGDWEPAPLPEPAMLQDNRLPQAAERIEVTAPASDSVWVGWTLPPASDGSRPTLEALSSALGGPHGLLRRSLADSNVLADPWVLLEGRALILAATLRDGATADDAEDALVGALRCVADGVSDDESWELAGARWALDAAAWDRARTDLVDRIAQSYKLHREWSDVVSGISGTPRSRAEVEGAATMVLARDRVAMHVQPGPPWAPQGPALPVDVSWTRAKTPPQPSAFAASLAASPRALVEPRFLSEGMHFERSKWGNAEVITHAARGPLYWIDIGFPVGVRQDPYVCDAARYRARTWLDSGALPGVEIETWCTADTTNISVTGVSDSFGPMWAELWERLDDSSLPPDFVKAQVVDTLRERAVARGIPHRLKVAMSTFAWHAERGLQHHMPSDDELAGTSPARFEESLRRLAASTPDIAFSGPNPEQLRRGLPSPRGPRPHASHESPALLTEHTFYVIDVPGLGGAEARLQAQWVSGTAREQLLADLYVKQPGPAFDAARGEGAVAFAPGLGVNAVVSPGFTWGFEASHEGIVDMLKLALEDYVDGPDPSRYGPARAKVETNYRHQRYTRIEIPRFVQMWSGDGDPRLARWNELGRMKPEVFTEYALKMGKQPLSIALLCDVSKTDVRSLEGLGKVIRVSLDEVLRNVEDRHVSTM